MRVTSCLWEDINAQIPAGPDMCVERVKIDLQTSAVSQSKSAWLITQREPPWEMQNWSSGRQEHISWGREAAVKLAVGSGLS